MFQPCETPDFVLFATALDSFKSFKGKLANDLVWPFRQARVDELGKYINILHDMDPQCAEETENDGASM